MTNTPFIIYALPRSRTAWLSKFLTYKDWSCSHEIAMTMKTPEEMIQFFTQPNRGTAETGVAQGWWLIEHAFPNIKKVVIKRPIDEVIHSVLQMDISGIASYDVNSLTKHMAYGERLLNEISKRPDVLTVNFHDLKYMEVSKQIFEHCLPHTFDVKWWGKMKNQNIQINMKQMLRYYYEHKKDIDIFKSLCKKRLINLRRNDSNNELWKDII